MKVNEFTDENAALATRKLLLVPYSYHHVPTYHEWMQDPVLQAATASEPLSLDDEYAMQQSWREDRDKLTFIICLPLETSPPQSHISPNMFDGQSVMIGDINMFLFELNEEDANEASEPHAQLLVGEIELMIARQDQRKKGFGRSAVLTFADYVLSCRSRIAQEYGSHLVKGPPGGHNLTLLRVKINHANTGSIHLFKSLGFQATSEEPNYFGEIELRWRLDQDALRAVSGWEEHKVVEYR